VQGKPKFSEKTCLSATFVHHKIPHDRDSGLNPGRRGGKPATNRLSYGAASSGINVHDWEVCRSGDLITLFSSCPDTFDQIVYVYGDPKVLENCDLRSSPMCR
jgi:hypothetical protein